MSGLSSWERAGWSFRVASTGWVSVRGKLMVDGCLSGAS